MRLRSSCRWLLLVAGISCGLRLGYVSRILLLRRIVRRSLRSLILPDVLQFAYADQEYGKFWSEMLTCRRCFAAIVLSMLGAPLPRIYWRHDAVTCFTSQVLQVCWRREFIYPRQYVAALRMANSRVPNPFPSTLYP
jgi:hypothetical protein